MHIYQKRPQPIQAEKVQAEQLKFETVYTIEGNKYEGKPGDWLVLSTKNNKLSVAIMTDEEFTAQYATEWSADTVNHVFDDFTRLLSRSAFRPFLR